MSEVFISYRQTDDAQKQRVRAFAERLRNAGIDVILDQFFLDDNPGGPDDTWAKWSSDRALETEYVLIVGTPEWFQCFDNKQPPGEGLGAACEAQDLRLRIYEAAGVIANIRVVLFNQADRVCIPGKLRGYHCFQVEDDFSNIVRWLQGKRRRSKVSTKVYNQDRAPTSGAAKSSRLTKEDNPFKTAGALPYDHKTYIRRASDREFERLIAGGDRLIHISGEFLIGKSSLMMQARRLLPSYQFFGRGLADLGGSDESIFMKKFFGLFSRHFGPVSEWDELEDNVNRCPSVLFLDDIGEVSPAELSALFQPLVARLTEHEINLRVIATSSQPLHSVLSARGLNNSKHSKPWKRIEIAPCTRIEACELLQRLPSRSLNLVLAELSVVENLSRFAPQPLQCLCYRLFEGECDGLLDRELSTLIRIPANYE